MLNALKNTLIFNEFDEATIIQLLKKIKYTKRKYLKGENVAFRGDKIESLAIIVKGSVETEMLSRDGSVRKIENLKESDILAAAFIFGENNNFPVDIKAVEDVEILYVPKREFLKLLQLDNKILENFLNEISNKTQLLSFKIWENVNNKTIIEKLNNYLVNNSKNNEIIIESVKNLSESFGVARPSLSRALSEYVKEGKLERIGRNKYRILDKFF